MTMMFKKFTTMLNSQKVGKNRAVSLDKSTLNRVVKNFERLILIMIYIQFYVFGLMYVDFRNHFLSLIR